MRKIGAPFVLFLLCVCFYWKLTLTNQYTFLDSPDLANLDLPRLQFQASAWRHSHLPLWDPYQWAGQPFLGQVTGAAYPANWLLAIVPYSLGKLSINTIHWYFVLIHFQAALFAYLLCRDWKRSHAASIMGGLLYSAGGFLGTTDWPQILNGAVWLPLVVLYLFRALRGRRALFSAAMSGALLGVTWLSGHHEVPIYATTALAGIWVAAFACGPQRERLVPLAAAAGFAMALIAAAQVLPAQEYAPLAKRWVGLDVPVGWNEPIPYSVHQHYSWQLSAIPGLITPRPPVHVDPFIGIVAFCLLLLGIHHGWRRLPQVRLLCLLAGFGIAFSLASGSFIHGVLYSALPVFGKARVPARALVLVSLAASPLVAYGLDALRRISSRWLWRTTQVLLTAGTIIYAVSVTGLRAPQSNDSSLFTAFAAVSLAVLLAAWRHGAVSVRFVACASGVLMLTELSNASTADLSNLLATPRPGYLESLFHHNDIASFLRAQPGPIRVDVSDGDIAYNFGDWHGIPALGGFAASATANLLELERHKPRVQDLLGISYYVGRREPRPGLQWLSGSASGVNVYRNPSAFPRAWAVHAAEQAVSHDAIRARLDDPAFDPRRTGLLLTPPPNLASCAPEWREAEYLLPENPNRVRIRAQMACRGMVILSDTDFPGWRATVDGRPVEILAPFGALRGVVVEAGSHQIEFVYLPRSAIAGAALSIAGIFFVLWTGWRSRVLRA